MKINLLTSFLLFLFTSTNAQQLFTNTNIQKAYEKGTRSTTGKPGKNYWENHANYDIQVNFDPATQLLRGHETITYENNSPDTLKRMIWRLKKK